MGRDYKRKKGGAGRVPGGFSIIPWDVLDSPAYRALSHPARSLLIELARQFVRDNNGRLLASMNHLSGRGWKSNDTITKALRELAAAGFIHQTVQGHRPNKASWYAITWQDLDRIPGYDHGATALFRRGSYRHIDTPPLAPPDGVEGTPPTPPDGVGVCNKSAKKSYTLTPPDGVEGTPIAPPDGVEGTPPTPPDGAIEAIFPHPSTPPDGDHLEKPSTAPQTTDPTDGHGDAGKSATERVLDALRDGRPWTESDFRAIGITGPGSVISHLRLSYGCAIDSVKDKGQPVSYVLKSAPEHLTFRAGPNGKRRLHRSSSPGSPTSAAESPGDTQVATPPKSALDAVLTNAERSEKL